MRDVVQDIKARLADRPLSERLMGAASALEALRYDEEVVSAVLGASARALRAEVAAGAKPSGKAKRKARAA